MDIKAEDAARMVTVPRVLDASIEWTVADPIVKLGKDGKFHIGQSLMPVLLETGAPSTMHPSTGGPRADDNRQRAEGSDGEDSSDGHESSHEAIGADAENLYEGDGVENLEKAMVTQEASIVGVEGEEDMCGDGGFEIEIEHKVVITEDPTEVDVEALDTQRGGKYLRR